MGDTAAVRYDRQVRLWGKSTQQQLMHTTVALYGVGGAAAEAAKNLVLAGIQAIAVLDDSPVRDVDGSANYLMQGEPGDTRGARARRSLQRLNPHVAVCDAAAALDAGASARVTVAAVASVKDATAHLRTATVAPGSDIVVLHAACGPTVLALFLYRRLSTHTLAEQWDRLVADPALLEAKPRGYQRVVLALHTRSTHGGFAAAAAAAYAAVERLRLSQITAADVQAVAQLCAGGGREDGGGDCVSATVAGACVAQHVIRQLGALAEAPPDAQSHRWMLCACGAEVECVVGL